MTETGAADLAVLRAFEPVIRFSAGELILPTAVEPYVVQLRSGSWNTMARRRCLVSAGGLTLERPSPTDPPVVRPSTRDFRGMELERNPVYPLEKGG